MPRAEPYRTDLSLDGKSTYLLCGDTTIAIFVCKDHAEVAADCAAYLEGKEMETCDI